MTKELLHLVMTVNADRVQETEDGYIVRDVVPVVDDVVMNGGLYPAAELETSYQGLSGKPAPIKHPRDADGNYISAMNGEGLRNYYAGATCENVRYEGGRVLMDVVINKAQALAHPDGARLIDAINGLEPIHISTGLLLQREEMEGNSKGKDYKWIARNMSFDHVAILLDEQGAATPDDGVGMWVNVDQEMAANMKSYEEKKEEIEKALRDKFAATGGERGWLWVSKTYDDHAIYEQDEVYYRIDYITTTAGVELVGEPMKVEKKVEFVKAANKLMKRMLDMVANSMPRGYTDPINPINANQDGGEFEMTPEEIKAMIDAQVAEVTANHKAEIEALTAKIEANELQAKSALIAEVAAATGLEANELQDLPASALDKLLAKSKTGFSVNGRAPAGDDKETYEMAE